MSQHRGDKIPQVKQENSLGKTDNVTSTTPLKSYEQELQRFLKKYPEYNSKNDPDGIRYNKLLQSTNQFQTDSYYSKLEQAHQLLQRSIGSIIRPAETSPPQQTTYTQNTLPAPVPVVNTPPNTIFCNGTNWSRCPVGQDFICPSSGSAYCQLPRQPQTQNNNQSQIVALQNQILDIKQQYYNDSQNLKNSQTPNQKQAWDAYNNDKKDYDNLAAQILPSYPGTDLAFQTGKAAADERLRGLDMQALTNKVHSDIQMIDSANQEKQAMLQNLTDIANQKIAQLTLQIQRLQLSGQ